MKICIKCNIDKDIKDFNKQSSAKDGLCCYCKICIKNKNKISAERIRNNIPPRIKRTKEEKKILYKIWKYKNIKLDKDRRKRYYEKYKVIINKKNEILRKKNWPARLSQLRDKRKVNPLYRLSQVMRAAIYKSITGKGFIKSKRTFEIIGCTKEDFKYYIESKWEYWMNWENYGKYNGHFDYGWDLDHIIPISSAKTEQEIIDLNHYTNFQPLCSKVNRFIKINNLQNIY